MTDDPISMSDLYDLNPVDRDDVDEAVERGIEVDDRFVRHAPGHYEAEVRLPATAAANLGVAPSVVLTVTPARVVASYLYAAGPLSDASPEIAWEPADPEAQARAYRQALTDPAGEALHLVAIGVGRDAEGA
jgi:hypothetical protein